MKILHHYIQRSVIAMTALVVLIITGLQTFISLINEMNNLGRGHYNVKEAFDFVLLSLPYNVYPLFPVIALIACLIALGRFASQSELIVMRTSGVSKLQITFSVMRTAILMLVVVTFVGEYLAPSMQSKATHFKKEALSGHLLDTTREGGWIRDGESFIYISSVSPDGKLNGILRYQFQDDHLVAAAIAKNAVYQNQEWVLEGVSETYFHEKNTTTRSYAQQIWPVSFDPKLIGLGQVTPGQTSLLGLHRYIDYLQKSGLSAKAYEFSFWKRLFQPLVTLVMIGLAIPFIFGPLRTATMGSRILVGVIVGFGFYTFNEFLGPFSLVYQIPPLLSAAMPIILFLMINVFLFRKSA